VPDPFVEKQRQPVTIHHKGKGEKQEDHAHPEIAQVTQGAGPALIAETFRQADNQGGKDAKDQREAHRCLDPHGHGKGGAEAEEEIKMQAAVNKKEGKKEKDHDLKSTALKIMTNPPEVNQNSSKIRNSKKSSFRRRSKKIQRQGARILSNDKYLSIRCSDEG